MLNIHMKKNHPPPPLTALKPLKSFGHTSTPSGTLHSSGKPWTLQHIIPGNFLFQCMLLNWKYILFLDESKPESLEANLNNVMKYLDGRNLHFVLHDCSSGLRSQFAAKSLNLRITWHRLTISWFTLYHGT